MTLTFRALLYLYAFDNHLPFPTGLADERLLRTARLDYSVQSLERIDVFLDALRKTRKIDRDTYLDDPANQGLLYLLAFYVGEVIGRSLGAAPQWATYAEMQTRGGHLGGPQFENSVTLMFPLDLTPRTAWLLPLASICSRLFDEHVTKSVLFSAGLMLPPESQQKPACQQPLPPVPAPAWPVDVAALARDWRGPARQVEIDEPPWARSDDLHYLFDNARALLHEGRVVWGALVQVNLDLFDAAGQFAGAPGEVLYDPTGRVPREDLAEMADKVFALKGQEFQDPALAHFSRYLTDEKVRVFGLDFPAPILPCPLKVSSTWFQRAHLPGGVISDKLIPLLISDAHPGAVLPLPALFRPGAYVPDPELAHLEPASLTEEGHLWFQGTRMAQDYGKARAAWEKAKGNPGALNGLGKLYEQGLGVAQDLDRALEYYEMAEAKDYGPAAEAAERLRAQKQGAAAESKGLLGRFFGKK
jgi:hypothetical protein